jgi:hypothetical protein
MPAAPTPRPAFLFAARGVRRDAHQLPAASPRVPVNLPHFFVAFAKWHR